MIYFNKCTDKILLGEYDSSMCELLIVDATGNSRRDYILDSFDFFSRREAQEFADELKARGCALAPTNIHYRPTPLRDRIEKERNKL